MYCTMYFVFVLFVRVCVCLCVFFSFSSFIINFLNFYFVCKRKKILYLNLFKKKKNALPWPGPEPGSSDSELSALTTGLLDKTVALASPRYSIVDRAC